MPRKKALNWHFSSGKNILNETMFIFLLHNVQKRPECENFLRDCTYVLVVYQGNKLTMVRCFACISLPMICSKVHSQWFWNQCFLDGLVDRAFVSYAVGLMFKYDQAGCHKSPDNRYRLNPLATRSALKSFKTVIKTTLKRGWLLDVNDVT